MAEMQWQGFFHFKAPDLKDRTHGLYLIPVSYVSVLGGDLRVIDLTTPQEEDVIVSELSQAKNLKNFRLFLEVTENIHWLFDLLEISARGLPISFEFAVQGTIGKTLVVGRRFVALDARISQPQEQSRVDSHTGKRFLQVRFEYANAAVLQGFVHYSPFMRYKWQTTVTYKP